MINSRRIGNEIYVLDGLSKDWMFWNIFGGAIVVQLVVMLVPQVSGIFDVYNCSKKALKACKVPVEDTQA